MRHGRIQLFTTACGLAVSLTAVAAEPPSTGEETAQEQAQTEMQTETQTTEGTTEQAETGGSVELEFSGEAEKTATVENAVERNCWDSSTWGEGESADTRCEKAGFLLGEQAFEEAEGFDPGFFTNRPDPMAIRPMYSEELLMRFDTDKDGSLSGQERTTTEVFLEARRSSHKSSLTYRFDFDESEDLSAAEKLEARRVLFLEQTEALNVLVETFDADRDGVLNERECMVARLKDAEAFYEVAFHEGRSDAFAYREGPGLPSDRAEAFEEASDSLKAEAKADQAVILQTVFVAEAAESTAGEQTAMTDGEQAGESAENLTETVAEAETEDEPG